MGTRELSRYREVALEGVRDEALSRLAAERFAIEGSDQIACHEGFGSPSEGSGALELLRSETQLI